MARPNIWRFSAFNLLIASLFLSTGWLIRSGCDHGAVDAAGDLEGSLAHRLAVPLDGCLQGIAEIAEQMPYLDGPLLAR